MEIEARSPFDVAREEIGASEIARRLGISPQAVGQWRRVPAERVLEVEKITGLPRHEIRPDIYPAPQKDAAA